MEEAVHTFDIPSSGDSPEEQDAANERIDRIGHLTDERFAMIIPSF